MSAHNNFLRIQFRFSIFKTKVWTFVYLLFDSWFPNHSVLCVCRLRGLALLIAVILPVFALSHESANKRILCAVIFAHGQSHSVCLLYSSKCFIVIARGVHTIFFLLSAASSLSCILVHFCHFVCSPVLRRWALFFPLLLLLLFWFDSFGINKNLFIQNIFTQFFFISRFSSTFRLHWIVL